MIVTLSLDSNQDINTMQKKLISMAPKMVLWYGICIAGAYAVGQTYKEGIKDVFAFGCIAGYNLLD